jgi:hypothetical protein
LLAFEQAIWAETGSQNGSSDFPLKGLFTKLYRD